MESIISLTFSAANRSARSDTSALGKGGLLGDGVAALSLSWLLDALVDPTQNMRTINSSGMIQNSLLPNT